MKKLMMGVAVALMTAACSTNVEGDGLQPVICPTDGIALTRGEQELVTGSNDFAFNLLRRATDEVKSEVLSPLSITFALGMLNNGAAGETQAQMNKVLGFSEVGQVNDFCSKMLTQAPRLDPKTKVMIANTIYMNKPYRLKPSFVETANAYYDAQPETRDFHDGKTLGVINQWASDHTEKMIEKVLDESSFNPDAVSYLLNATYFKGEWTTKFNEVATQTESFYCGDGTVKLPMMHQTSDFGYGFGDGYQLLRMPYGNGNFEMTIVLPDVGTSLQDVKEMVHAGWWNSVRERTGIKKVDVKLPRFETKTDVSLREVMSAMGMPKAFTVEADFSGFCDVPTHIEQMKQVARIKVNEEGSEAAAVTVVGLTNSVSIDVPSFIANRPFLYFISELSTGTIFFIGQFTGR